MGGLSARCRNPRPGGPGGEHGERRGGGGRKEVHLVNVRKHALLLERLESRRGEGAARLQTAEHRYKEVGDKKKTQKWRGILVHYGRA